MRLTIFIMICMLAFSETARSELVDFDRDVAPILAARCLECHDTADHKSKLDLSSKSTTLREKDAVIKAGSPKESVLWEQVEGDEMPPKKPLNAKEKAILKTWIEQGAQWGKAETIDRFAFTTDARAGANWWSLLPMKKPALPAVRQTNWPRNGIDHFVLAQLESRKLSPATEASPRVLIRRVFFDLIGLPPTPEEVDMFVNECEAEQTRTSHFSDAYSRLIDRLLASPHYGERWARHWLDVARYTESQGFEYDRFRPNAWHYRDYVIQAFNSDKRYDVFMQEQIAGDVMNFETSGEGVTAQGMIATSLLVCGPYDQAGNSQANATQRKITREEEMEDLVSVIGQTFLGMTINCARCHSHKFDPITQADYYSFKAVFDGVHHGERAIATPAQIKQRNDLVQAIEKKISSLQQSIYVIDAQARSQALKTLQDQHVSDTRPTKAFASPVARWTFDKDASDVIGSMHGQFIGGAVIRDGRLSLSGKNQYVRTAPLKQTIREKTMESWVLLPTHKQGGGSIITLETNNGTTFDAIVLGERQASKWIAGSDFFRRTKDLKADQETADGTQLIHMAIVYAADGTITVYRNGKQYAEPYKQHELQTYNAGEARVLLGMRHTGAGNGSLQGEIESASLYDRALSDGEVALSFAAGAGGGPILTQAQLLAAMTEDQRTQRSAVEQEITILGQQMAAIPPVSGVSYIGKRQQPPPTHRLSRGDVNAPAEAVAPAGLSIIKSPSFDFGLAPDAPEAERRIKLAQWLASPQHPLTARVMVNRIWHHHFGRGIVDTPNDFGFNGSKPTHPELLDWLAAEFTSANSDGDSKERGPWSIKRMHKLVLMSATYRQSSVVNERAANLDADNTLLWHYAPRRIEGEIVRDAMLAVSGELNPQIGGPSYKPFTVSNHGSDFYHLKDMIGPQYNRRTIYRANVNSGKSALMDALDCPDPSIKTPSRRVTTTPLAALALMNNSFVQRQAAKMANRLMLQANNDQAKAISLAYRTALGRAPTQQESQEAGALAKDHGLETLCWALLNASEFMYVK